MSCFHSGAGNSFPFFDWGFLKNEINQRYLDIRYSVIPNVVMEANDITFEDFEKKHSICDQVVINGHGILRGNQFSETLEQIKLFVSENPKEFIVIKMQQESYELNTLAKHILIRKIEETIGDHLIKQVDIDWWFKIETVSMELLWEHKKNILLIFRKELFVNLNRSEYILKISNPRKHKELVGNKTEEMLLNETKMFRKKLSEKGLHDKKYFIVDRWHDTDNPEHLVHAIDEFLEEKKEVKEKLTVSQVILTNQRNIWNHVKKFYKKGLISIEKLCNQLHQEELVSNYLIEGLYEKKFDIGKDPIFINKSHARSN